MNENVLASNCYSCARLKLVFHVGMLRRPFAWICARQHLVRPDAQGRISSPASCVQDYEPQWEALTP